jgi:hypothetical protein
MEPSLKGGITKTRIAVRSEKQGSTWLTVIGQEPLYRIYQVMTGTAQTTPAFVPTLTWAGAEHVLLGTVFFGGFTFDSDPSFPLHFKLVQDVGYVYLCGRGTVSMPGGQKVTLGDADEIGDFVLSLIAEDQLEREAAAEALGWLVKTKGETDQAVPALIKALKDNAMEVRRNAAAALGRIGDVRAQAPLSEALKDEDEWVRAVVSDAFQKLEQPASDS